MELLIFREIAVMAASFIAGYTDLKTGYIYDWITYPLIAFGLIVNIFEQEYTGIILGAIVFAVGYVLYYTGKLGGGDVKLYTGIGLALPFFANGVFVLSVIILSALAALVFLSVYYLSKYFRKGINVEYNKNGIKKAALLGIVIILYLFFLNSTQLVSEAFIIAIGVPLLLGIVFLAFERGIRKEFFLKKIKLSEMEEDELVAFDFMEEQELKKFPNKFKGIIGKEEAEELKKNGVKELLVYRDLPRFGIFIFVGVILTILFPEITLFFGGGFL
ncbi:MAG TPA: A24 family peptidase [archaeon]|nr:A24 family peptidase [archaeon]